MLNLATPIYQMPTNYLGPLITSKTRLKLLLRFFVNQDLSGYLQGLSKELEENSNSVRVELKRLEEAGLLLSEEEGRRKVYRVNKRHPLTADLTSIIRKVTGIDELVDRVVNRVGESLKQVWIGGNLARGIESDQLEVVLVGSHMDQEYIAELINKVQVSLKKEVHYAIVESISVTQAKQCIQVWERNNE